MNLNLLSCPEQAGLNDGKEESHFAVSVILPHLCLHQRAQQCELIIRFVHSCHISSAS